MSDYDHATDRRVYSGTCANSDCMANMAIWAHPEKPFDLPANAEWETPGIFLDCPVCDETMDLDFVGPMGAYIATGYPHSAFEVKSDD